jgi:translation initiation factor IF-2
MSKKIPENIISRPPVVVILGHVDHGKSSILEAVKDIKITEKESGGITQHIGAYEIEHIGKKITFIDTPGHEAFSSMRSRGARVADIAILVVAADEGVKPQTEEAIDHIKKAGIPMIVVLNKMDKPDVNVERISQQLAEKEIYLESIGGKVPAALISAKKKQGLEDLLELIILTAELEDFVADTSVPAEGIIVESHIDSMKGCTVTAIVEKGILKKQDIVATKTAHGKIKSLKNFQNKEILEASPSMPVTVCGFNGIPFVGDNFKVFSDIDSAQKFVKQEILKDNDIVEKKTIVKNEEHLNLILKTDFLGSLEAVEGMLNQISQERVGLKIIKSGVGDINESDIKMAKSGKAEIVGFKVKSSNDVVNLAERSIVNITIFNIIYELVEHVKKLMEKTINPRKERIDLGKSKVLAVFIQDKNRQIVGCKIIQGEMKKGSYLEIFRLNKETKEEDLIGKGKISNLKRGEKNVDKIVNGEECGILFEGSLKIEEGDVLLAYIEQEEKIVRI